MMPNTHTHPSNHQTTENLTWHSSQVARAERASLLKQKGATIWLTGFSGSGKSTVASYLERALTDKENVTYCLDGDNIRLGINRDLGFSEADRVENIRRIGEVAKLFADAGLIVITSFISPYRADRDQVRKIHDDAGLPFIEIFIDCPITEAEKRDPKGLYKKARAGLLKDFTGIDAPYEAPVQPEVHLKTHEMDLQTEIDIILTALKERGLTL